VGALKTFPIETGRKEERVGPEVSREVYQLGGG